MKLDFKAMDENWLANFKGGEKGLLAKMFADEQNKIIRESYTDHDGNPMANSKGHIAVERTYDIDGKLVSDTGIPMDEQ